MQPNLPKPFHTTSDERSAYLGLITVGILVFLGGIALEFFAVSDPHTHGFWAAISLLGLGITTVFTLIIRMPNRS